MRFHGVLGVGWHLPAYRHCNGLLILGPFTYVLQKRWRSPPPDSSPTRLQNRITDHALDRFRRRLNKLHSALNIIDLMHRRNKGQFVSLQLMSRWKNVVGLNIPMGVFLHSYPHVFDIFTHPVRRNLCCRVTQTMVDYINREEHTAKNSSVHNILSLKKLLLISSNRTLSLRSLQAVRKELGFPLGFVESVLSEHPQEFRMLGSELELVSVRQELGSAHVEKWRKKEYAEKWLKESETKYAFPLNFPPRFVKEVGFKEGMRNWQLLPYLKPYESERDGSVRSCRGVKLREKQIVGVIHEFLSLTVEKMVAVDQLVFFREGFGLKGVNTVELFLKHPGIFYISAKGGRLFVFLRECFWKEGLVDADHPVYQVRREMMEFMLQCDVGSRVGDALASSSSPPSIVPQRHKF